MIVRVPSASVACEHGDVSGIFGPAGPDRHFEAPERVTLAGNVVVREAWWTGTCAVDLPGFGTAGTRVRFKFCSILRFDDGGTLVEWKDFG